VDVHDILDYLVVFVAGVGVGLLIVMLLEEVERREVEALP
jgi:hypothetical protein